MRLIQNFVFSEVRQIFACFCNLIALTLGENSAKDLRVTTTFKFKFEWVSGKLESKRSCPETIIHKIRMK